MHLIRTTAALAQTLTLPLDSELHNLLSQHRDRLTEFGDEPVAEFLIVEASDTLAAVEQAYGSQLVAGRHFAFPVELITEHRGWFEVVWIISDDGYGLVLFIENHPAAERRLTLACRHALTDSQIFDS